VNLLAHSVDVAKALCNVTWHLFIKVLMALVSLLQSGVDELLCRVLIDVVLQPRQIEPIETESDQVKKRLDIVQG
jgi:hypothetical protein